MRFASDVMPAIIVFERRQPSNYINIGQTNVGYELRDI